MTIHEARVDDALAAVGGRRLQQDILLAHDNADRPLRFAGVRQAALDQKHRLARNDRRLLFRRPVLALTLDQTQAPPVSGNKRKITALDFPENAVQGVPGVFLGGGKQRPLDHAHEVFGLDGKRPGGREFRHLRKIGRVVPENPEPRSGSDDLGILVGRRYRDGVGLQFAQDAVEPVGRHEAVAGLLDLHLVQFNPDAHFQVCGQEGHLFFTSFQLDTTQGRFRAFGSHDAGRHLNRSGQGRTVADCFHKKSPGSKCLLLV